MDEMRRKRSEAAAEASSFSELADLVRKAGIRLESAEKPVPKDHEEPPPREIETDVEDSDDVFKRAMESVPRSHWRRDPASVAPIAPPATGGSPGAEDERLFLEAMRADCAPPILEHPEYIEGWIGVAGQRFISSLRSGVYSIQGSLDLHGLSQLEAREAVEEFIVRMSRQRSCCVKIVHGRGINSPADKAILKECLQRWLTTRRMSHHVVAYASAPYTDGGVGAIYLLLRRSQK
jgi:DNA-nicking Smr family endonuclease